MKSAREVLETGTFIRSCLFQFFILGFQVILEKFGGEAEALDLAEPVPDTELLECPPLILADLQVEVCDF
jgi:hypothetical protein